MRLSSDSPGSGATRAGNGRMKSADFIAALPENRPLWLSRLRRLRRTGVRPTPATRCLVGGLDAIQCRLVQFPMNGLVCSASTRCWASFRS